MNFATWKLERLERGIRHASSLEELERLGDRLLFTLANLDDRGDEHAEEVTALREQYRARHEALAAADRARTAADVDAVPRPSVEDAGDAGDAMRNDSVEIRVVRDHTGREWVCSELPQEPEDREDRDVRVACVEGAQTVELRLQTSWRQMTDADLAVVIEAVEREQKA